MKSIRDRILHIYEQEVWNFFILSLFYSDLFSAALLRSNKKFQQNTNQVYLESYIKVAGFADFSGLSDIKLRIVGRKKQN